MVRTPNTWTGWLTFFWNGLLARLELVADLEPGEPAAATELDEMAGHGRSARRFYEGRLICFRCRATFEATSVECPECGGRLAEEEIFD